MCPFVRLMSSILLSALALVIFANSACAQMAPQGAASAATEQNELSVSSEARGWNAPTAARVTISIEHSGASAAEASGVLDSQEKAIKEAVLAISPHAMILSRGQNLSGVAQKSAEITPGAALKIERLLGIEVKELDKVSKIVDAALQKGATSVPGVEYVSQGDSERDIAAINEATDKAKLKAKAVASSLGLKLGSVLSVMVTEEPAGLPIQAGIIRGAETSRYADRAMDYYVNIRFSVGP